jgi:hypothetical protein
MAEQVIDLGSVIGPTGQTGPPGKTAYEMAVEGGFAGTEAEYTELLVSINNIPAALENILGE